MKKKLALKDLQVKSFVTTIEAEKSMVMGGAITADCLQTLPLADCISRQAYSACRTCQFQCFEP